MTAPAVVRSAYPPPVDRLLPEARKLAEEMSGVPSRNRLMREFRIGASKADALRAALTQPGDVPERGPDIDTLEPDRIPDPGTRPDDPDPDPMVTETDAVTHDVAAQVDPDRQDAEDTADPDPVRDRDAGTVKRRRVRWPRRRRSRPAVSGLVTGVGHPGTAARDVGDIGHLKRVRWGVRLVLALGVAASIAGNVLHARDNIVSQVISAWSPLALLLTVELISRVPVHRAGLAVGRWAATTLIAGIAAWVSYWHMTAVAVRYGETSGSAHLLPLSVDGLIVVASICLVELGGRITTHIRTPLVKEIP
ncbi:hypothetical protein GCM10010124_26550 [Pilimelia terevasa]|uniref:DUF2637 domain-containing protein n=1 Tax=Pilimelia terevasa TaxID=53372 RepID=A0A8J3FJ69_9ACTN|nr:DUF2637 domain-containing protein [Pilimelia terevasa]GGK32462.1 hypothetical protein GCM10010124_26550 [Pilimelia terevasa]